jgi:hypothetical protein
VPSANADAPTSLSSLVLLGLHRIGGSTDVPLLRVRVVACSAKSLLTMPLAKRTGWSKRETARFPPSEPEPSPAAALPPSTGAA